MKKTQLLGTALLGLVLMLSGKVTRVEALCMTNLLVNPGFEAEESGWEVSSSRLADFMVRDPDGAHSGNYYAALNGFGITTTERLAQAVFIPAGVTRATLTFFLPYPYDGANHHNGL